MRPSSARSTSIFRVGRTLSSAANPYELPPTTEEETSIGVKESWSDAVQNKPEADPASIEREWKEFQQEGEAIRRRKLEHEVAARQRRRKMSSMTNTTGGVIDTLLSEPTPTLSQQQQTNAAIHTPLNELLWSSRPSSAWRATPDVRPLQQIQSLTPGVERVLAHANLRAQQPSPASGTVMVGGMGSEYRRGEHKEDWTLLTQSGLMHMVDEDREKRLADQKAQQLALAHGYDANKLTTTFTAATLSTKTRPSTAPMHRRHGSSIGGVKKGHRRMESPAIELNGPASLREKLDAIQTTLNARSRAPSVAASSHTASGSPFPRSNNSSAASSVVAAVRPYGHTGHRPTPSLQLDDLPKVPPIELLNLSHVSVQDWFEMLHITSIQSVQQQFRFYLNEIFEQDKERGWLRMKSEEWETFLEEFEKKDVKYFLKLFMQSISFTLYAYHQHARLEEEHLNSLLALDPLSNHVRATSGLTTALRKSLQTDRMDFLAKIFLQLKRLWKVPCYASGSDEVDTTVDQMKTCLERWEEKYGKAKKKKKANSRPQTATSTAGRHGKLIQRELPTSADVAPQQTSRPISAPTMKSPKSLSKQPIIVSNTTDSHSNTSSTSSFFHHSLHSESIRSSPAQSLQSSPAASRPTSAVIQPTPFSLRPTSAVVREAFAFGSGTMNPVPSTSTIASLSSSAQPQQHGHHHRMTSSRTVTSIRHSPRSSPSPSHASLPQARHSPPRPTHPRNRSPPSRPLQDLQQPTDLLAQLNLLARHPKRQAQLERQLREDPITKETEEEKRINQQVQMNLDQERRSLEALKIRHLTGHVSRMVAQLSHRQAELKLFRRQLSQDRATFRAELETARLNRTLVFEKMDEEYEEILEQEDQELEDVENAMIERAAIEEECFQSEFPTSLIQAVANNLQIEEEDEYENVMPIAEEPESETMNVDNTSSMASTSISSFPSPRPSSATAAAPSHRRKRSSRPSTAASSVFRSKMPHSRPGTASSLIRSRPDSAMTTTSTTTTTSLMASRPTSARLMPATKLYDNSEGIEKTLPFSSTSATAPDVFPSFKHIAFKLDRYNVPIQMSPSMPVQHYSEMPIHLLPANVAFDLKDVSLLSSTHERFSYPKMPTPLFMGIESILDEYFDYNTIGIGFPKRTPEEKEADAKKRNHCPRKSKSHRIGLDGEIIDPDLLRYEIPSNFGQTFPRLGIDFNFVRRMATERRKEEMAEEARQQFRQKVLMKETQPQQPAAPSPALSPQQHHRNCECCAHSRPASTASSTSTLNFSSTPSQSPPPLPSPINRSINTTPKTPTSLQHSPISGEGGSPTTAEQFTAVQAKWAEQIATDQSIWVKRQARSRERADSGSNVVIGEKDKKVVAKSPELIEPDPSAIYLTQGLHEPADMESWNNLMNEHRQDHNLIHAIQVGHQFSDDGLVPMAPMIQHPQQQSTSKKSSSISRYHVGSSGAGVDITAQPAKSEGTKPSHSLVDYISAYHNRLYDDLTTIHADDKLGLAGESLAQLDLSPKKLHLEPLFHAHPQEESQLHSIRKQHVPLALKSFYSKQKANSKRRPQKTLTEDEAEESYSSTPSEKVDEKQAVTDESFSNDQVEVTKAANLQTRLLDVFSALSMNSQDMLTMLEKFSHPDFASTLTTALDAYEKCVALWQAQQELLRLFKTRHNGASSKDGCVNLHGTGGIDDHSGLLAATLQAAHACRDLFLHHHDIVQLQGEPLILKLLVGIDWTCCSMAEKVHLEVVDMYEEMLKHRVKQQLQQQNRLGAIEEEEEGEEELQRKRAAALATTTEAADPLAITSTQPISSSTQPFAVIRADQEATLLNNSSNTSISSVGGLGGLNYPDSYLGTTVTSFEFPKPPILLHPRPVIPGEFMTLIRGSSVLKLPEANLIVDDQEEKENQPPPPQVIDSHRATAAIATSPSSKSTAAAKSKQPPLIRPRTVTSASIRRSNATSSAGLASKFQLSVNNKQWNMFT